MQFKTMVENQLERKIKVPQTDGGTEFKSFSEVIHKSGIVLRKSCPYTSVQNGRIERKHRQVVEMGLSLFSTGKSPSILLG